MSNSNEPNWNLEEYNQICQRDRTDGNIFWNKVTVLIAVNFSLLSVLSLKDGGTPKGPIFLPICISGLIFSVFWGIVLIRQAVWVEFWKSQLRDMEKEKRVMLTVQTKGDDFARREMCCFLRIGSYKVVAWLPLAFLILWFFVIKGTSF